MFVLASCSRSCLLTKYLIDPFDGTTLPAWTVYSNAPGSFNSTGTLNSGQLLATLYFPSSNSFHNMFCVTLATFLCSNKCDKIYGWEPVG